MSDRILTSVIKFFNAEWSGALLAVVVLSLAFGLLPGSNFFAPGNLMQIVISGADIGLIAAGMTIVILTAGIDLSVGSILVLVTSVIGYVTGYWAFDPVTAIFFGLATGLLVGMLQGVLIAQVGMPAFIVTLAGLSIWRGLANFMTKAQTSPPLDDFFKYFGSFNPLDGFREPLPDYASKAIEDWSFYERLFAWLNGNDVLGSLSGGQLFEVFWLSGWNGFQMAFFIHVGFFVLLAIMMSNMRIGRYMYAIGSNEQGARQAGINTKFYLTLAYIILGFCCALAGVVRLGLSSTATPLLGNQYELLAIAAVVIGGTSLFGGRGTIWGTFLGVLLIKIINNGFIQSGLASTSNEGTFVQMMLTGTIILIAVGMDIVRQKASPLSVQRFLCGAGFACLALVVLAPGYGTFGSGIAVAEHNAMVRYIGRAEAANAEIADEVAAAKQARDAAQQAFAPFQKDMKAAKLAFNRADRAMRGIEMSDPRYRELMAQRTAAFEAYQAVNQLGAETQAAATSARWAFNDVNGQRIAVDQKQRDRVLDEESLQQAQDRFANGLPLALTGMIALILAGLAIWRPVMPYIAISVAAVILYGLAASAWVSPWLAPLAILGALLIAGSCVVPRLFLRARALTKVRLGEA